jgi:hypothetical protein
MTLYNRIAFYFWRSGVPGLRAHVRGLLRLRHWAGSILSMAVSTSMIAMPAVAGQRLTGSDQIGFYSDIGNAVSPQNPLVVRPSTLLLAEDGSVALIHLRWTGWGTSRALATGVWSASNCNPSCATGARTTRPARLTLSRPGFVGGHRVYRCFEIIPAHPQRDIEDHACIRGQGGNGYETVSAPTR